jgi:hypothetical protein
VNACGLEMVPTGVAKRWNDDKDGHGLANGVGSSQEQGRVAPLRLSLEHALGLRAVEAERIKRR